MPFSRITFAPAAEELVKKLQRQHGELIFHQSGGCCDGSSPMLLPKSEMYLNETDVLLGEVSGVKFYMNEAQFEYWKHTHLTVDVTEGRGSSFSLEIPTGHRFIIRSRLLTKQESEALKKA